MYTIIPALFIVLLPVTIVYFVDRYQHRSTT